jgi:hypothetical protein
MSAYTFQQEGAAAIIDEGFELLNEHYEEIYTFEDIELKPDFEMYLQAEANGSLRVFTVRSEDKALQGYAVFFVSKNPHHKDSIQAVQDVVFIRKSHRGFGGSFLAWCDEQFKLEKIQAVYHHVNLDHNWGPMLEKMNYKPVEMIYVKRLDYGGTNG